MSDHMHQNTIESFNAAEITLTQPAANRLWKCGATVNWVFLISQGTENRPLVVRSVDGRNAAAVWVFVKATASIRCENNYRVTKGNVFLVEFVL